MSVPKYLKPVPMVALKPYLGVPEPLTREFRMSDAQYLAEFERRVARNVAARKAREPEYIPMFLRRQAS